MSGILGTKPGTVRPDEGGPRSVPRARARPVLFLQGSQAPGHRATSGESGVAGRALRATGSLARPLSPASALLRARVDTAYAWGTGQLPGLRHSVPEPAGRMGDLGGLACKRDCRTSLNPSFQTLV